MTRQSIIPANMSAAVRSSDAVKAEFASMKSRVDLSMPVFFEYQEHFLEKNFAKLLDALLRSSPFAAAPSVAHSSFCQKTGQNPNEVFVAMAENVCSEIERSGEYRSPGVVLHRRFSAPDVPGIWGLIARVKSGEISFEGAQD